LRLGVQLLSDFVFSAREQMVLSGGFFLFKSNLGEKFPAPAVAGANGGLASGSTGPRQRVSSSLRLAVSKGFLSSFAPARVMLFATHPAAQSRRFDLSLCQSRMTQEASPNAAPRPSFTGSIEAALVRLTLPASRFEGAYQPPRLPPATIGAGCRLSQASAYHRTSHRFRPLCCRDGANAGTRSNTGTGGVAAATFDAAARARASACWSPPAYVSEPRLQSASAPIRAALPYQGRYDDTDPWSFDSVSVPVTKMPLLSVLAFRRSFRSYSRVRPWIPTRPAMPWRSFALRGGPHPDRALSEMRTLVRQTIGAPARPPHPLLR